MVSTSLTSVLCVVVVGSFVAVNCCRIGSERLKLYTRDSIEYLLDAKQLESVYWPEAEPLDVKPLAKATGLNITLAETHFRLGESSASSSSSNEVDSKDNSAREQLIRDIFVACSIDRGRSYALSINLELTNPFKVVEVEFNLALNEEASKPNGTTDSNNRLQRAFFLVRLPQSSFLVNLRQRVRYDECLTINYVQLAPHSNYEIECPHCTASQQSYLDKIFSKRMTQLESQLDSILSEKLLLGLQVLLSQQRLELDLLLENYS